MGGLVRCVACGEVQWNLRFGVPREDKGCRVCGEALSVERRRPGRRFTPRDSERRDARPGAQG